MAIRKIIFRGKDIGSNEWVYGHYTEGGWIDPQAGKVTKRYIIHGEDGFLHDIDPETLGEFTDIVDKNGQEIYEGDFVKYYSTRLRCINPDCDPPLWGYYSILETEIDEVCFDQCVFGFDGLPLTYCGINYLDDIRKELDATEEDGWRDADGNVIDESILGLEVVGNIYDNKEDKQ